MISVRTIMLAIAAAAYSAGFWILETYLQQHGCADSIITAVACTHNLVSTFLCAFVFLKMEQGRIKYAWASAFAVVGIADFIHGFSHWVYPLDPIAPLATVFGELYTVFLILLLISLYKSFETLSTRLDTLAGAAITAFFCTIMLVYISVPLWSMELPWYLKVFETLYTVLSSAIIAIIFAAGLRTRFASGLMFLSSLMLIFCSDFAIRFSDNSAAIAQLSVFNYGWELGFSLVAILCASLYLKKEPLRNLFELVPFRSIRFEIGSISFVALSLFALLFIITSNRALTLSTQDVSLLLLAFLLSWALSNAASLWVSNNVSRIRHLIDGRSVKLSDLSIEIADLLAIYQSKNDTLASAMEMIEKQKGLIQRTYDYIAHDMRSPLSVLKSYVDMEKGSDAEEDVEYRAAAGNSVEKLLRMAEGMVDYSKAARIERGRIKLKKQICEKVLLEVHPKAARKNVAIQCDVPDYLYVDVDAHKIGRVLVNLINNAIQASESGTGLINLDASMENGELSVTISDNGKGIDEHHIPHIFDSFYTAGKRGGVGLGLSYCKEVVEAHGGTIQVRSEVGKGTSFTIQIPGVCISL